MKNVNDIIRNKLPNILLFVILDITTIFLTSYLALWLRFDFGLIPENYLGVVYKCVAFDAIIMLLVFLTLKLYTSLWKYASITEFINVIIGCISIELICLIYKTMFNMQLPRSFYLIHLLLMILFVCSTRFSYRIIRAIYSKLLNSRKKRHAMLIGAGDAGRLLIDEILNNQESFDYKISCVIDDNKRKQGNYIKSIPICGSRKDIERMAIKYEVDDIIIAMPSAPKKEIDSIVTECQKTKCKIKILPAIYKTMDHGKEEVSKNLRPLSYEDFLGRDEIVVDSSEISNNITNKVILVTGGGGSIGSELCRQIAKCNPRTLIIFDIYENNAYDIQQELLRTYPNLDLHTIIGSVRDYDRLEKVFEEFKPNQVFHAAAHKHVPLMEVSPNEAIKNNCLGTLNACKLADKYKVKKFVLISTDKCLMLLIEKVRSALKNLVIKPKIKFSKS